MADFDCKVFDLNAALERLAARVCREIKSQRRRLAATAEFRAHLEDAAEDIMRQGYTPEATYAELEKSLGDTDKLATLMASVHNTRHVSLLLPWLVGAVILGGLLYLWMTSDNDILQAWLGVGLQLVAMAALVALLLFIIKWVRAIGKRAVALRRLKKHVKKSGGTITRRENPYKSLFVRTSTPELTVDIGDCRYILSLWATVKRHRTLHLQDNGIYSYDKHFGYMLATPGIAPHSRITFFRPKGMENDTLFTFYHYEMMKLPEGAHLMPNIRYSDFFASGKTNIPVFLLNPIPLNVEICENGRIHRLADGDILPDSMGNARVLSMSGLLSVMARE